MQGTYTRVHQVPGGTSKNKEQEGNSGGKKEKKIEFRPHGFDTDISHLRDIGQVSL